MAKLLVFVYTGFEIMVVKPYAVTKKKLMAELDCFCFRYKNIKMVNASAVGGTPNSGVRID